MKLGVVVDRGGVPLAAGTDAASVPETVLGPAVLAGVPPEAGRLPWMVPVPADRGHDSDPLREELAGDGFRLIAPHRRNHTRPPTNDGRRLQRYRRRYVVERTFSWLQSFRRVATRYEVRCDLYDAFVAMACAFVALNKLL